MKLLKRIHIFKLSFILIFLFVLQKQFFILLGIDILPTFVRSINLLELSLSLASIPVIVFAFYYIPVLLVVEVLSIDWISFKQIDFKNIKHNIRINYSILKQNKNNLLCVYRC